MAFSESYSLLPEDPIFGLARQYKQDQRSNKVNLGIGTYLDAEEKPYILTTIREAEKILFQQEMPKEYLPIEGNADFIHETLKLIFGENHPRIESQSVFAAQTVGGTCALRIGGDLIARSKNPIIYISNPTWPNHPQIFNASGLKVEYYNYYNEVEHKVDFESICASIATMPSGSVLLLQACCHNPTGVDFSKSQWEELSQLLKERSIIPFFDIAYQGFGDGLEEDVQPIRYFANQGHEMMVAYSFSKNLGLYGERVGLLAILAQSKDTATRIGSHVRRIIRTTYSNPPRFGALLATTILKSTTLREGWQRELKTIRGRLKEMREALAFGLMSVEQKHINFSFLMKQKGMFSFSGLSESQVAYLKHEKGIYMIDNGRINIAGLNQHNLEYVINSIAEILGE